MSISKDVYDKALLQKICEKIFKEQNVRCYFCEVIGKRWSFLAGDQDILAAPQRYMVSDELGILADKEIIDLDQYLNLI